MKEVLFAYICVGMSNICQIKDLPKAGAKVSCISSTGHEKKLSFTFEGGEARKIMKAFTNLRTGKKRNNPSYSCEEVSQRENSALKDQNQ